MYYSLLMHENRDFRGIKKIIKGLIKSMTLKIHDIFEVLIKKLGQYFFDLLILKIILVS